MAPRILIVDDHQLFRATLRRFVESRYADALITEADNGLAAVRQCQQQQPDLILMDVQMPVCDGIRAAQQIKTVNDSIPVLLYSADAVSDTRIGDSQSDAFLEKQFVFERLPDEVARLLAGPAGPWRGEPEDVDG